MNLFFKIQTLQLLIFCKDDREFVANLDYVLLIFLCNIIKFNHFCIVSLYCYIQSLLFHLLQLCLLHMYIFLLSQLIILLSSFEVKAILLLLLLLLLLYYFFSKNIKLFTSKSLLCV